MLSPRRFPRLSAFSQLFLMSVDQNTDMVTDRSFINVEFERMTFIQGVGNLFPHAAPLS